MPALLWSGMIFFLCFLPGSKIPKEDWLDMIYFDKIVHAGLYFILFFLLLRIPFQINIKTILLAIICCMLQGIIIELVQGSSWIEHRGFDAWDIVANFFGLMFACTLYYFKLLPVHRNK